MWCSRRNLAPPANRRPTRCPGGHAEGGDDRAAIVVVIVLVLLTGVITLASLPRVTTVVIAAGLDRLLLSMLTSRR